MSKAIAWNKIKADYLNGVTPKELANKYKITAKQIHDKASRDNWVAEKASISEKTRETVQERIKELTNLALETLCKVINDPESDNKDKVSASRAILDVSGLKSLKQEVTGVSGMNVIINREAVQVESDN
jgi:replicative superfamily II helicase